MTSTRCPQCAFSRSWKIRRDKRKCKQCRKEWSPKQYPAEGIRSTKEEWMRCIQVFLRERTVARISEETGIPHCRAERMAFRLRECMETDRPVRLPGIVEMDETYIGGQRKNKRLHIRRMQAKRGHGTDKLPIVGLFSRLSGTVYAEVLPKKLDAAAIFSLIGRLAEKGGKIYTDGFKMYRGLKREGYDHQYVDHDGGELVRDDVHTNNIEGFWGILKRKLSCIGGMRREHLHLFLAEISWRFNHRGHTLAEQEKELLRLVSSKGFGG